MPNPFVDVIWIQPPVSYSLIRLRFVRDRGRVAPDSPILVERLVRTGLITQSAERISERQLHRRIVRSYAHGVLKVHRRDGRSVPLQLDLTHEKERLRIVGCLSKHVVDVTRGDVALGRT
jgi:hypothetical protein